MLLVDVAARTVRAPRLKHAQPTHPVRPYPHPDHMLTSHACCMRVCAQIVSSLNVAAFAFIAAVVAAESVDD